MSPNTDITLPVVSNIYEAEIWANDFASVLTVGPEKNEVDWGHKNHKVFTFGDTTGGKYAPKISDVEEAIYWGAEQEDLLVHCHAGMSRSTSTAWGISILKGADPLDSFLILKDAQPEESYGFREFIPNGLIVKYLEKILSIDNLLEIRQQHMTQGWNY